MLPQPPAENSPGPTWLQLREFVRDFLRKPGLQRDTFFLIIGTMIGAFGGLAYWKIITLRYSTEVVGLGSAAISTATFLGNLACLGFPSSLIRFMPGQLPKIKVALISFSYRIAILIAIIISVIFLTGRIWWAPTLIPLQYASAYAVVFTLLAISISTFAIVGGILQAERLMPLLIVEYMVFNIIQIGGGWLMPLHFSEMGLVLSYALPTALVSLGFTLAIPLMIRKSQSTHPTAPLEKKDMFGYSLGVHIYSQIWNLPLLFIPLIVIYRLGAVAGASLAITWYAYSFLSIIPASSSAALFIDGSYAPSLVNKRLYQALKTNLYIVLPMLLVTILFAPWLLGFFGQVYASAAGLLRLMALSIIPGSVSGLYLILLRVRKQIFRLIFLAFAFSAGSITLCYVLIGILGLEGLGWAWLISQTIFAVSTVPFLLMENRAAQEGAGA